jgi:hypothetical protein
MIDILRTCAAIWITINSWFILFKIAHNLKGNTHWSLRTNSLSQFILIKSCNIDTASRYHSSHSPHIEIAGVTLLRLIGVSIFKIDSSIISNIFKCLWWQSAIATHIIKCLCAIHKLLFREFSWSCFPFEGPVGLKTACGWKGPARAAFALIFNWCYYIEIAPIDGGWNWTHILLLIKLLLW